jgi:hypothetical protein
VNIRLTAALFALVALIGALGASAQEPQVSHLWLSLGPVRLGGGWTLVASGTSPEFDTVSGNEILGVTLERRVSARARETHALRPHLDEGTFSFDGREGRWQTAGRAGSFLAVDMVIRASGEPEVVAPDESLPFACRGPFFRVHVTLTGVFSVRTGTKAFKTLERRRLTGVMTYARGGPVECGLSAPPRCEPSTYLTVSGPAAKGSQSLMVDRGRRGLVAQFSDANQWSHVMALTSVGVLSRDLPRIGLKIPAKLPILGSAVFVAGTTTEASDGDCITRITRGSFNGSLRVRFSAWGERTLGRPPDRGRLTALYRITALA